MIPRRLERRTYSYQKYTLPFKLRNLIYLCIANQEHSDLNWEFEVWSFLFCQLNYTLFFFLYFLFQPLPIAETYEYLRVNLNWILVLVKLFLHFIIHQGTLVDELIYITYIIIRWPLNADYPCCNKYALMPEKRWFEHPGVKTQYLANILPYRWRLFLFFLYYNIRVKSASIRHQLPWQGSSLPIKLLTLIIT